jgi:hypothetical protein
MSDQDANPTLIEEGSMRISRFLGFAAAALVLISTAVSAQVEIRPPMPQTAPKAELQASSALRPATWGTAHTSVLRFPASAFLPTYEDGATKWAYNGMARWQIAGFGVFGVPVLLPSGAQILGIELSASDTNLDSNRARCFSPATSSATEPTTAVPPRISHPGP